MGLGTAEIDKCANGFNRESAMLKLPKRGENGASQGEGGGGSSVRVIISTLPNLPLS